jgi:hypothetical protein
MDPYDADDVADFNYLENPDDDPDDDPDNKPIYEYYEASNAEVLQLIYLILQYLKKQELKYIETREQAYYTYTILDRFNFPISEFSLFELKMHDRNILLKTNLFYPEIVSAFTIMLFNSSDLPYDNFIIFKKIIDTEFSSELINLLINNPYLLLEKPIHMKEIITLIKRHQSLSVNKWTTLPKTSNFSTQTVFEIKDIENTFLTVNNDYSYIFQHHVVASIIQKWFRFTLLNWRKRVKLQLALVVQHWFEHPDNPITQKLRFKHLH